MKSICSCCSKPRRERTNRPGTLEGAHGLCRACLRRWDLGGRPAAGPPPPMSAAQRNLLASSALRGGAAWRAAEFRRMRQAGYTIAQAAGVLGVTYRAGWNYERGLRGAAREAA